MKPAGVKAIITRSKTNESSPVQSVHETRSQTTTTRPPQLFIFCLVWFINPNIIVTTVLLFRDVGEERDMVVGMLSRCLLFEGQMWAYPVTVTERNNIKISTFL